MDIFLSLLTAVLAGGVFAFLQFLITRRDEKKGYIAALSEKIDALWHEFHQDKNDNRRRRIFDFQRQERQGIHHTHEEWSQCLDDITDYEKYCDTHRDYRNDRCQAAIENLKRTYRDLLMSNGFEK